MLKAKEHKGGKERIKTQLKQNKRKRTLENREQGETIRCEKRWKAQLSEGQNETVLGRDVNSYR
jgi:hypothetical protein